MSLDFLNPKITGKRSTEPAQSEPTVKTEASMFKKLINNIIIGLVFLIPVFFLPFTTESREFNKQALIIVGVLLAAGAWVIRILVTRKAAWVKTSLDFALLGYLAVYLVSSLFSIDKASSFLGYYGRFTGSFISVLILIVLYYVVVNNVRGERILNRIANSFMVSSGLVIVYSLLQLFGRYILPAFTHSNSFNPVGSMVSLSIFAAISVLFYQWMMVFGHGSSLLKRYALGVLTVLGLGLIFLINAFVGWLILALAMIVFIALAMLISGQSESAQSAWLWKPMVVLVVAILFVAFNILPASLNPHNLVANLNLPVEIQLSNSATFSLVKNSLSSGAHAAMIGSGPGTTGIAYGQIKPEVLNKTIVWSLNFDRASSEFANIIIETGLLGLIVFEATSLLFLAYALYFLLKKAGPARSHALGFFMIFVALYLAHFFYFFNTTFYFLYWLAIGLFMSVSHSTSAAAESAELSFNHSPRQALSWMFASLVLVAIVLVGLFFEVSQYVAEASYTNGINTLNQKNPDFSKAQAQLANAVNLNQYRDVYLISYAQDLLFLSSVEAAKKQPNVQNIQNWISDLINAAKQATVVSPNKASNWSALAQFYTSIKPLGVQNTDSASIDAWNNAISHDSKNPALYVQLASAYANAADTIDPSIVGTGTDTDKDGLSDEMEAKLGSDPKNPDSNGNGVSDGDEVKSGFNPAGAGSLSSDILAQYTKTDSSMLKKAEDNLNKAIALKQDLPDPYIALARVLEKENKLNDAKSELDNAAKQFPFNPDILFEQGRITYNQGKLTEAATIFNNVLKLEPKHANALYSLALIDLQNKDNAAALAKLKQVREITGPNVDLDKMINSLENPTK